MTTWSTSSGGFDNDLISPYGDLDVVDDFNTFWASGVSGVTVDSTITPSWDSGSNSLKILSTGGVSSKYTRVVSGLVPGATYVMSVDKVGQGDTGGVVLSSIILYGEDESVQYNMGGFTGFYINDFDGADSGTGDSGSVLSFISRDSTLKIVIDILYSGTYFLFKNFSLIERNTWNTSYGGFWDMTSFVDWEDLDKHSWEDWN